ncbi:MAG: ATPase, T2SS/T4P/T4SS family [Peptostreptococcaceae bacterium]
MSTEQGYASYKLDIDKVSENKNKKKRYILDYDRAFQTIVESEEFKIEEAKQIEERLDDKEKSKKVIKNKPYFRKKIKEYESKIHTIAMNEHLTVKGYDKNDLSLFVKDVVNDMMGFSVLRPLMEDEKVSDIFCLKWNKIYYEKGGKNILFNHTFKNEKHYKDFIERMLREAGKSMLDYGENKVIDFDLYEDRYNAISTAVAPNDFALTIRKHSEDHIKLKQIVEWGCVSQNIADLMGMLIIGESNVIISGVTGSGKTTTMRALLDEYVTRANKRMLVCEDTRELFPENDHTLELVTSKGVDPKSDISLRELIILALRQKPKYIVVGEVRGPEAESAVEGMATGHSTIFSMHSGTPIDAVNRLVTKYIQQLPTLGVEVVERIIGSALDYIIIQDDVPGIGRRITSLTEVTYSYETQRVALRTIIKYDFRKKDWVFMNKLSEEKAEKMLRKGITLEQLTPITEGWMEREIEERKKAQERAKKG